MIFYSIFIIDDEKIIRDGMSMALEADYNVISFSDAESSIKAIAVNPPDLVLLDIGLPKMNGIEFLKIAKADETLKKIPVVVLTTSKDEQDKVETFNLGVAGYIAKPTNYKKFVETVRTIDLYWTLSELPNGE